MEANVLVALEDVSRQVKEAGKDGTVAAEALQKRGARSRAWKRNAS